MTDPRWPKHDRLYRLALRTLHRRGVNVLDAADWSDDRLLRIPGFGQAKLEGWRSKFPLHTAPPTAPTPEIDD